MYVFNLMKKKKTLYLYATEVLQISLVSCVYIFVSHHGFLSSSRRYHTSFKNLEILARIHFPIKTIATSLILL